MTTPARKRLIKDLDRIQKENQEDVVASPCEGDLMLWTAYIEGAEGTPWEGGMFTLKLQFTENYPNTPPQVKFMTKMFHPNIYNDGRICLDMLNKQWSSVYDVWAILTAIKSLLSDPNTQSPANIEASTIFKENKTLYAIKVQQCVEQSLIQRDYESQAILESKADLKKRQQQDQLKKAKEKSEQKSRIYDKPLFSKIITPSFSFINYFKSAKDLITHTSNRVLGKVEVLSQEPSQEVELDNQSDAFSDDDLQRRQVVDSDDEEYQQVDDADQENDIEAVTCDPESELKEVQHNEIAQEEQDQSERDQICIQRGTKEDVFHDVEEEKPQPQATEQKEEEQQFFTCSYEEE